MNKTSKIISIKKRLNAIYGVGSPTIPSKEIRKLLAELQDLKKEDK